MLVEMLKPLLKPSVAEVRAYIRDNKIACGSYTVDWQLRKADAFEFPVLQELTGMADITARS